MACVEICCSDSGSILFSTEALDRKSDIKSIAWKAVGDGAYWGSTSCLISFISTHGARSEEHITY